MAVKGSQLVRCWTGEISDLHTPRYMKAFGALGDFALPAGRISVVVTHGEDFVRVTGRSPVFFAFGYGGLAPLSDGMGRLPLILRCRPVPQTVGTLVAKLALSWWPAPKTGAKRKGLSQPDPDQFPRPVVTGRTGPILKYSDSPPESSAPITNFVGWKKNLP